MTKLTERTDIDLIIEENARQMNMDRDQYIAFCKEVALRVLGEDCSDDRESTVHLSPDPALM